jgi:hypothetical protein
MAFFSKIQSSGGLNPPPGSVEKVGGRHFQLALRHGHSRIVAG